MTRPMTKRRLAMWREQWERAKPDPERAGRRGYETWRILLTVRWEDLGKLLDEIDRLRAEVASLKARRKK